jgi:integrase
MTNRRARGDGGIDQRGEDSWRLRYRINGRRYTVAFHGTQSDARKKLRELIRSGDVGNHIEPHKMTVAQWIDRWLAVKESRIARRTHERYTGLLLNHVKPALGERRLQQLRADEIEQLYANLAPATAVYAHVVLRQCLDAAAKKQLIAATLLDGIEAPEADEADHGRALDADELGKLLNGFRGTSLFPIVATAALTGGRRGEILALRWTDFDPANRTLRIARALELAGGRLAFKLPKTGESGIRTITIDHKLVEILLAEREKVQRLIAGVPDGAAVDLGLIKLPVDALIFPSFTGAKIDLTKPRSPAAMTLSFLRHCRKIGFRDLRFHDLRGTHETMLLDNGVPIHVVAARAGHDPATLLKNYAKRTKKADESAADVIGELATGLFGGKQ